MNRNALQVQGFLLVALFCCLLTACGPGGTTEVPGAPVSGTVLLDGKPMPSGQIEFAHPESPETQKLKIEDGKFSGNAPIAECTVRIMDNEDPTQNTIPPKWNAEGGLNANVTEDESTNVFEFKITSK